MTARHRKTKTPPVPTPYWAGGYTGVAPGFNEREPQRGQQHTFPVYHHTRSEATGSRWVRFPPGPSGRVQLASPAVAPHLGCLIGADDRLPLAARPTIASSGGRAKAQVIDAGVAGLTRHRGDSSAWKNAPRVARGSSSEPAGSRRAGDWVNKTRRPVQNARMWGRPPPPARAAGSPRRAGGRPKFKSSSPHSSQRNAHTDMLWARLFRCSRAGWTPHSRGRGFESHLGHRAGHHVKLPALGWVRRRCPCLNHGVLGISRKTTLQGPAPRGVGRWPDRDREQTPAARKRPGASYPAPARGGCRVRLLLFGWSRCNSGRAHFR